MPNGWLRLVRHTIHPIGTGESRHVRQAGKPSCLDNIWLDDVYPGLDQTLDALQGVFLLSCCHGNIQGRSKLGKAVGMIVLHRLLEPHVA